MRNMELLTIMNHDFLLIFLVLNILFPWDYIFVLCVSRVKIITSTRQVPQNFAKYKHKII